MSISISMSELNGSPKKTKSKSKKGGFFSLLRDERTPKIIGLMFLLFSLFLLVAFTSYFFTWKQDFHIVKDFSFNTFSEKVSNQLGVVGAVVGHFFFFKLFGLPSVIFVFLFFAMGLNLAFKHKIVPIGKTLRYSFLFLTFSSVALSFIFWKTDFVDGERFAWGGAFGEYISGNLINIFGFIGTGAILAFAVVIFLVIVYNINLKLPSFGKKTEEELSPVFEIVDEKILVNHNTPLTDIDSKTRREVSFDHQPVMKESEIISPPLDLDIVETEEEEEVKNAEPVLKTKERKGINGDDLDLDIEEGAEEVILNDDEFRPYDPTLDLSDYKYPTLDLLEDYGEEKIRVNPEELERNKDQIVQTLRHYNIEISKIKATIGPTVTLYEIVPAAGVRISKIKNLEDDIALSLAALGIRIIAPIPGKGTIGIEVPNINKEIVSMRTLLSSEKFQKTQMDLPIALGKNIANEIYIADLAKMPHLLMAGATGQGKSVGINAVLISLLYKKHPSQVKFVLVDPKKVELSLFEHIEKHFLAKLPGESDPIITDTKKVVNTLNSLCIEMDLRYDLLKNAKVRNIKEYNAKFMARRLSPLKGHRYMPYIILVVDEFADLIMTAGKEIEMPIARLAQLARAVGLHLLLATQRPSVNIITGTIKANFPARISFKVASKIDSRTILDSGGADQLIGRGDMLLSINSDIIRLQCAFVDTPEVERVTEFISSQRGYPESFLLPEYVDEKESGGGMLEGERDPLFEEAAKIIVQNQMGSTSLLQRRMKLGYNRAGRLMDQLEQAGVVGNNQGSKARDVLIHSEIELEQFLQTL